jgi:hypothetical protein
MEAAAARCQKMDRPMTQPRKSKKRSSSKSTPKGVPSRKISATLIDFAKPILEHIDENTTREQVNTGLIVAITVWNAIVIATWGKGEGEGWLEKVRPLNIKQPICWKSLSPARRSILLVTSGPPRTSLSI